MKLVGILTLQTELGEDEPHGLRHYFRPQMWFRLETAAVSRAASSRLLSVFFTAALYQTSSQAAGREEPVSPPLLRPADPTEKSPFSA